VVVRKSSAERSFRRSPIVRAVMWRIWNMENVKVRSYIVID
jgi:hypothetical protein